jgi:hypothetical protein
MENEFDINKSSRHQKIIGNFGENLICNFLSRSGFEVSIVDHTGIDLIAYHKPSDIRLGISVKSRTRTDNLINAPVNIFSYQRRKNDRQMLLEACQTYACKPWIAIYVETKYYADVYLTSLANYDMKYRGKVDKKIDDWKMRDNYRDIYQNDRGIKHIKFEFHPNNWVWSELACGN